MAAAVYQSWYGCGTQTMADGRRPRSPAADDDYDDDDDNYCGAAAAISSVDEAGCTVTYISLFLLNILFTLQSAVHPRTFVLFHPLCNVN